MKPRYKLSSPEEIEIIKNEYLTTPVKPLARKLGVSQGCLTAAMKRLGLVIPPEIIEQRKQIGRIKKGDEPHNKGKCWNEYLKPDQIERIKKTQYKKGNIPHNANFDGHERFTKNGYIQMRIKIGEYQLKHVYYWEQKNGKIPAGCCLRCLDGNKQNTDPSNWELVERAEMMLRNSRREHPKQLIPSMVLRLKLEKRIKQLEKRLENQNK